MISTRYLWLPLLILQANLIAQVIGYREYFVHRTEYGPPGSRYRHRIEELENGEKYEVPSFKRANQPYLITRKVNLPYFSKTYDAQPGHVSYYKNPKYREGRFRKDEFQRYASHKKEAYTHASRRKYLVPARGRKSRRLEIGRSAKSPVYVSSSRRGLLKKPYSLRYFKTQPQTSRVPKVLDDRKFKSPVYVSRREPRPQREKELSLKKLSESKKVKKELRKNTKRMKYASKKGPAYQLKPRIIAKSIKT